jgi:cytochrome P450
MLFPLSCAWSFVLLLLLLLPAVASLRWAHLAATAAAAFVAGAAVDWWRHRGGGLLPYYPVVGHAVGAAAAFKRFPDFLCERSAALGHPATVYIKATMFSRPRHILLAAADLEHVQKTAFHKYLNGGPNRGAIARDLVGQAVPNVDGARWAAQRKVFSREFTPARFRNTMTAVFVAETRRLIAIIDTDVRAAAAAGAGPARFNASFWLPRLTLDAFARISMGADIRSLDGAPCAFADALHLAAAQLSKRARPLYKVWTLLRWLDVGSEAANTRAIRVIDGVAYGLIDAHLARRAAAAERRGGGGEAAGEAAEEDLLSRLIPSATDAATGAVDRRALRDHCVLLLGAGSDTTALTLLWLLYELAVNPAVEAAVVEEWQTVLGADAAPNYDNCAGLQYLHATVCEAVRLHPAVPFNARDVAEDDVLPSGATLKRGDMVIFSSYVTSRRPELWGTDASAFRPERWIDADSGKCRRASHFHASGFGGGRRACPGEEMALFEMKVVAVALLQRFRFTLSAAAAAAVRLKPSAMLQMQDDLILTVVPR